MWFFGFAERALFVASDLESKATEGRWNFLLPFKTGDSRFLSPRDASSSPEPPGFVDPLASQFERWRRGRGRAV